MHTLGQPPDEKDKYINITLYMQGLQVCFLIEKVLSLCIQV